MIGVIPMKYPFKPVHWVVLIATLSAVVLIAGCTSSSQPPVTPAGTQTQVPGGSTVTIQNFAFSPAEITVPKGTTVTWVNEDSVNHQIADDTGTVFTSESLPKGATYSFTFDMPGSYPYHCSIHPSMKGTVVVT
jgi:plastocyanin